MAAVEIDARAFHRRARLLLNAGFDPAHPDHADFNDVGSVLILAGAADDNVYLKSASLQQWLLGYAFPDSLMLALPDKIVFVMSQKRASYLEVLETARAVTDKVPIEILKRTKDEEANKALFVKVLNYLTSNQQQPSKTSAIGSLQKEKPTGKFIDEWTRFLASTTATQSLQFTDVSTGIAAVLASKDADDAACVSLASTVTSVVMRDVFVEEFQGIVGNARTVTHEKLCLSVEKWLGDEKKFSSLKLPKEATMDLVEWCYPPIIQSGGKYDLKPSAVSDTNVLHGGTVLCSLGVRFKNYCCNISRTFLVNPESSKEKNYNFLLELQGHVLGLLKEGTACKEVYDKAVEYIQSKRPDLVSHFVKSAGFGIGIEFKESAYVLGPKSTKKLKAGMTVNLSLGFQNLENTEDKTNDPKNKIYALLLADTVKISSGVALPVLLTDFDKEYKDISYEMDDEEEESLPAKREKTSAAAASTDRSGTKTVLKTKLRSEEMEEDEMTNEQKRAIHQKQLAQKLQDDGISRFGSGEDGSKAMEKAIFRKFACYRKEALLPKNVEDLKILVDRKNEAIVLPIFGQPVPFHVSTLKSVAKNDEGDSTYLRFNFVTPGQSMGKKESNPFEDENATFVKSLTFRSTDFTRFSDLFRDVNEMKKEVQKREAERKEKADLVEQDKLIEIKGRRPIILREVFARPALEGKRLAGDLELHSNGLRYQSMLRSDQRIDILFSNIKHLFFQPCDKEIIVVLHIHLKNEIMIGRKKTKEVQFYREISDANFDETGNRRRRYNHGDEDELLAEQEERQRRIQLNKEFKAYAEKVAEASNQVDVDIPFRDLAFKGVPFRQPVDLQPTAECLVHLVEPPFLVITIADIEIVHLERVRFGLKSFDMVVVFKDFKRPVQHINSIPTESLEHVKEWLDSVDVCFTEGPVSLSWPQIMKTVNEDPAAFFEEGGWSCLMPESDESESEEEESEYEDSGEAESESEESDYDSGASGSGYSGSGSEEEETDGEDWDEMEKQAAKADRRKDEREQDPTNGSSSTKKKQKRRDDSGSDDEDSDDARRKKKKH